MEKDIQSKRPNVFNSTCKIKFLNKHNIQKKKIIAKIWSLFETSPLIDVKLPLKVLTTLSVTHWVGLAALPSSGNSRPYTNSTKSECGFEQDS